MSAIRDSFVARFGEDEAARIEDAAMFHHENWRLPDDQGTDPFADAFSVAIAFECVGQYADYHDIETSEDELQDWCVAERVLAGRIGPVDVLSLISGAYKPWLPEEVDA